MSKIEICPVCSFYYSEQVRNYRFLLSAFTITGTQFTHPDYWCFKGESAPLEIAFQTLGKEWAFGKKAPL
jgi:hypothetical protein